MKKTLRSLLVAATFWGAVNTNAQDINYGNPTVPFGSNTGYDFGILPSNLPTSGEYGASQDAADYYNAWYAEYVTECTDGRRYIHWDNEGDWVSEGVAYGMIIAAYMGDKPLVDDLWEFYKDNANANGLMGWVGTCNGTNNSGAASDAEVDAAMALIVAEYQWPNQGYADEARTLITSIYNYEVQPDDKIGPNQLLAGDSWGSTGDNVRNPGYIPMGYFKEYAAILESTDPDQSADWTNNIIPANYELLLANVDENTGLCSDGCEVDGTGGSNWGADFGDDASRFPWRTAVDAFWHGESSSIEICSDIATYCASKGGAATAPGKISRDGVGTGTVNLIYQSMFGAGVIGADPNRTLSNGYTVQSLVDDYYSTIVNESSPYYFHSILKMMSMMVMTGNFWRPGHEQGQCGKPDLGDDASLCGVGSLTLDAGDLSTSNRTFKWFKNDSEVNNETRKTLSVNTAGVYRVEADSAGCISKDEIIVSDVLPTLDLGDDIQLCQPSHIELEAGVSGDGIEYTWEKDGALISTEPSVWVREAGDYELTISASGCQDQSDVVIVESLLPTVTDGVICNEVGMMVVNDHSGDYFWYDSESSDNALHNGVEYSVSLAGTYWVEDASSFETAIGPESQLGTPTNWGEKGYSDNFYVTFTTEASFSILSLSLPYGQIYNNQTSVVEIEIRTTSGELKGTFLSDPVTLTQTNLASMVEVTFSDFTIDASWGTELIMSLNTTGTTIDGQLVWDKDGGFTFPYSDASNTISITGANTGGQSGVNYPFFYNWNVLVGSACARIPVVAAEGDNCGVLSSTEEIAVPELYPNPTTGIVNVVGQYESGLLSDGLGFVYMILAGESELDLSSLPSGVYHLNLVGNGNTKSIKVIKE